MVKSYVSNQIPASVFQLYNYDQIQPTFVRQSTITPLYLFMVNYMIFTITPLILFTITPFS
jgi:hypothetical protein